MRAAASSFIFASLVVATSLTAGCKSKTTDEKLYGDLPAPTPNKLAGVYTLTVNEPDLTTEIRLQFGDGTLLGAVKCTPTNTAIPPIDVDGQVDLQTGDLDNATGKFTVANFLMDKMVGTLDCQAGLRGATYDFKVEDLRLTITAAGIPEPLIYGKIGDDT